MQNYTIFPLFRNNNHCCGKNKDYYLPKNARDIPTPVFVLTLCGKSAKNADDQRILRDLLPVYG